jgi:ParB/RepB/Spo0J family partition protein
MTTDRATPTREVLALPLEEIVASPFRQNRNLGDLTEMAASIRARGVLQPILVRPWRGHFQMVVGARRLEGAKLANLKTIPGIVREMTDEEVIAAQIVADVQRRDIHPLDEATAFKRLRDDHKWGTDQIASEVGKSRSYVLGRLKLNELAPAPWEAFVDDKIASTTAVLIARIPAPDLQEKATREILRSGTPGAEPMSYEEASRHVQQHYMLSSVGKIATPTDIFDCTTLRARLTAGSCLARQQSTKVERIGGHVLPVYHPCGTGTCKQGEEVKAALGRPEAPPPQLTSAVPHAKKKRQEGPVRIEAPASTPASQWVATEERNPEDSGAFLAAARELDIEEGTQAANDSPLSDDSALAALDSVLTSHADDPPASTDAEPERAQHVKRPSRQTVEWLKFTEAHNLDPVFADPVFWSSAVLKVVDQHMPFDTPGQKLAALLVAAAEVASRNDIARRAFVRLAGELHESIRLATAESMAA